MMRCHIRKVHSVVCVVFPLGDGKLNAGKASYFNFFSFSSASHEF